MRLIQMICRNCKHWRREEKAEANGFHRCSNAHCGDDESPGGFLGGDGGEPYNSGGFASGPHFGCIYWETLE